MFAEDLDTFFSAAEHAIAATLQGGTTVNVLFDQEFVQAVDMVVTSNPVCLAKADEVAAGDVGSTLTVNGTAYTIRAREFVDDGALVRLQLEASS